MDVNITYQVRLANNRQLAGSLNGRVGESTEQLQRRILAREGLKDAASFSCQPAPPPKVTLDTKSLTLIQNAPSPKPQRKLSTDSQFQESSMNFERENFVTGQPEAPPLVRGKAYRCLRFCCCFTTSQYLELKVDELRFCRDEHYGEVKRVLYIGEILKLRSFRRKDSYYLGVELEEEQLEFSFGEAALCKEWLGYLSQAMVFNHFLQQKRLFSRADSFKHYMSTLVPGQGEQLVVLRQGDSRLKARHTSLPSEKEITRCWQRLVKLSEFEVESKVGSGSFSTVYLATRKGKEYALKQLSKDKLLSTGQMKYALVELRSLILCRGCPYVVPIHFAFQTPDYLYLALSYLPAGDLARQLQKRGPFSPQEALLLISELVFAIQYLHKKKIIYRDLKPENVMLDREGHLFLVDFGLAKELHSEEDYAESFLGTPLYLAPERFTGSGSINFKSDVYGVGCVFYQILHARPPFRGSNYHSLAQHIQEDVPEFRADLPPDHLSFLLSTLQKDPQRRLAGMSRHRMFRETDWTLVGGRKGKGVRVDHVESGSVQINYEIDEDYNEETYPSRLIGQWEFNCEQPS